ncbi:MAG: dienelactone hydrolase family protein [Woeseia sp.]|nr:dienelactone hydrolase family protein [Woeseia sp.]MBT6208602.1 dienelactone hydrolase family protein [Woeseia sp.]
MSGTKFWQKAAIAIFATLLLTACDSGTDSAATSGNGADRSDIESLTNAGGGSEPAESASVEPARPVVAERLPYAEVDEQLVYGHFAFPEDMVDALPGVIVLHERWGLDDGIRALADRIAGQGFVVLAVDLYGGQTATNTTDARDLMVDVVENSELANENIRQAYQFLNETGQAPRIGSLGWSFGGGWALNTAMLFPDDLDATVIYYGQVTDSEARLAPVNTPILGLFGENDRGVTEKMVRAFEDALENLGKEYEIVVYPDAGHAFADPGASNYKERVAEEAWLKVVEFLNDNLVVDAP